MIAPKSTKPKPFEIANALINARLLTRHQLDRVQELGQKSGTPLQVLLVDLNLVTERDILTTYEAVTGLRTRNPTLEEVDASLTKFLAERVCRKHRMFPLRMNARTVEVAMSNPLDMEAMEEAKKFLARAVAPALVADSTLNRLFHHFFEVSKTVDAASKPAPAEGEVAVEVSTPQEVRRLEFKEANAAVAIVNELLSTALRKRASDIHIEPREDQVFVRFRIDGQMVDYAIYAPESHLELVSRIKVMSTLDIAEKRLPQDGKLTYKISYKQSYDFRTSTFPLTFGEKVVLRVHDHSATGYTLNQLGLGEENCTRFRALLAEGQGIILVTGPTGSGKTTTLYAALSEKTDRTINIMTVEDPIEYTLPGVNQAQVNPKAGLTFAAMLRSILRQDPDVILVGEIRDQETAQMAFRAAMTGHLVLSTLHTNDAPSTISRLIDMGIEPYLVASSVIGVDSQRLVRRICNHCKEPYKPPKEELSLLDRVDPRHGIDKFFIGRGCQTCSFTGYHGRIGIFEMMVMTEAIETLVMEKAPASKIREAARWEGMVTMQDDALNKLREEVTTISAVRPLMLAAMTHQSRLTWSLQKGTGEEGRIDVEPG